jgi:hypothetical protein
LNFGFQKQEYKFQFLKFIQKFLEFKSNSKLNWTQFELIQRIKKNLSIHSGRVAVDSYGGLTALAQLPAQPSGLWPAHASLAQPARTWCMVTTHGSGQSDTVVSSTPMQRRRRSKIN